MPAADLLFKKKCAEGFRRKARLAPFAERNRQIGEIAINQSPGISGGQRLSGLRIPRTPGPPERLTLHDAVDIIVEQLPLPLLPRQSGFDLSRIPALIGEGYHA